MMIEFSILGANVVGIFIMKTIICVLILIFVIHVLKETDCESMYEELDYDCLTWQDKYDFHRCLNLQDKHLKRWFYRKTGIKFEKFFGMMVNSNTDKYYQIAKRVLKVMEPYFKRGIWTKNAIPPLDTSKSRQNAIITLKRMCFLYQIELYCRCVCYDYLWRMQGGAVNAWGALRSVLYAYGDIYGWSIQDEVDCLTMFHMPLVFWRDADSEMRKKYEYSYTLHRCRRIDFGDSVGI